MGGPTDILGKIIPGGENSKHKDARTEHMLAGMFRKQLWGQHSKGLASQKSSDSMEPVRGQVTSAYRSCRSFRVFHHSALFLLPPLFFLPSQVCVDTWVPCMADFKHSAWCLLHSCFLNKYLNEGRSGWNDTMTFFWLIDKSPRQHALPRKETRLRLFTSLAKGRSECLKLEFCVLIKAPFAILALWFLGWKLR